MSLDVLGWGKYGKILDYLPGSSKFFSTLLWVLLHCVCLWQIPCGALEVKPIAIDVLQGRASSKVQWHTNPRFPEYLVSFIAFKSFARKLGAWIPVLYGTEVLALPALQAAVTSRSLLIILILCILILGHTCSCNLDKVNNYVKYG